MIGDIHPYTFNLPGRERRSTVISLAGGRFFKTISHFQILLTYKISLKMKVIPSIPEYACKKPYLLPKTTQACKKQNSVKGMMSLWTLECWTKRNISSLVYQPQPRTRQIQKKIALHCRHKYLFVQTWVRRGTRQVLFLLRLRLRLRVTHPPYRGRVHTTP